MSPPNSSVLDYNCFFGHPSVISSVHDMNFPGLVGMLHPKVLISILSFVLSTPNSSILYCNFVSFGHPSVIGLLLTLHKPFYSLSFLIPNIKV